MKKELKNSLTNRCFSEEKCKVATRKFLGKNEVSLTPDGLKFDMAGPCLESSK